MAPEYETISELDRKLMGEITNWTHFWGGSQFVWDSNNNCLRVTSSFFGLIRFFCTFYGGLVYGTYLIWRCVDSFNSDRPVSDYSMCILLLSVGSIAGISCLSFILKEKEILLFVNSALESSKWFARQFGTNKRHREPNLVKRTRKLLSLLAFLSRFYGFLTGLISLVRPYDNIFPASLLPEKFQCIPIALLQGAVIVWATFAAGGIICSPVTWILVLGIGFIQTQSEVNLTKTNYWTKPALRQPKGLRAVAIGVQINCQLSENYLRSLIMPMQMVVTRTVHFTNFILIRHHHQIPWLELLVSLGFSVTSTIVWISGMHCAALIHKTGMRNVTSFRKCQINNRREKMAWMKYIRSIKPIGIKAGDFHTIKHKSVMAIASVSIRGTIRTLLAFKKRAKA